MIKSKEKKDAYPCKPQFYCVKVGCKGLKFHEYVIMMLNSYKFGFQYYTRYAAFGNAKKANNVDVRFHYVNVTVLIKFSQKTSVFTLIIISSP